MKPLYSAKILAANVGLYVNGDFAAVEDYFATDYVAHIAGDDLSLGHAGIRKVLSVYRRAFSDFQVDVEILVQSKDRVAWQRTLQGTQLGAFKGFPASQKQIVWRDMVTSRFQNDLIAEEWIVTDLAEQLLASRKR
ncbi:hypothetical protein DTL42_17255 [Bremerella cremea]|uniref:Ester cyclase n=1 Tax=Bremerella cremea TaxID=1031537 RepID=A0A368KQG2_9BACT|nr:ester cyclase [Bremerella cremea]RCS44670.1 hypothetical protein DTL42_17255 [Bremerella cremea]